MDPAATRTVYHISPLRLWLAPAIFVILAIATPVIVAYDVSLSKSRNAGIYGGVFFLALGVGMYLLLRYTRLVLSAEGINLYQFGYKLETTWSNVANLYDMPGAQGLVLHSPMDCRGAEVFGAARKVGGLFNEEQMQFIAERRFIPIEPFAYWLKKGKLRDDLIRHAPALGNG
jgi:hypothetical protein